MYRMTCTNYTMKMIIGKHYFLPVRRKSDSLGLNRKYRDGETSFLCFGYLHVTYGRRLFKCSGSFVPCWEMLERLQVG